MAKWKCKMCGYEWQDDGQPSECPACSAPQSELEQADEDLW